MKKIPPFRLEAIPLNAEAASMPGFAWAEEPIGKRHKLGGEPDFIQEDRWPVCPSCGEKMTFYAQLDSLNEEFNIADAGMIFVFICFDCFTVTSIVDTY